MANRIRQWLLGPSALWLAAVWGLAEAIVFFVVPDVVISAVALFSFRRSLRAMGAALAGALLGGALLFTYAAREPRSATRLMHAVPFVKQRMLDRVDRDYSKYGLSALCIGPTIGVPYKLYAAEGPRRTTLLPFLLVSVPARLVRFVVVGALYAAIGAALRKPAHALLANALCWIAFYAVYWLVLI